MVNKATRNMIMVSLAICAMAVMGENDCPAGNVVRRVVDAPAVWDGFGQNNGSPSQPNRESHSLPVVTVR